MKALRLRIQDAVRKTRSPQYVIEKDYALSYVLAGLAAHHDLKDSLIFKGGTALKKIYFGRYRFSEDLDFSTIHAPKGKNMEKAIKESLEHTLQLLMKQGPFNLQWERYVERKPHPRGQEAFVIRVQFPWHSRPLCQIKLEITQDEPILLPPQKHRLIHGYGERLSAQVLCYAIEEITAEKLRALLQTQQKLIRRGWNQPRGRDYYDLWRITKKFGRTMDGKRVRRILKAKCKHRGVEFRDVDDFFQNELIAESRKHWEKSLAVFIPNLPDASKVLRELRKSIEKLLA